jgi:multiple sugar transport system permease protein/raffinose/stachyose/melibiose transport system permease protein|tara:strand:+ start:1471 stop:2349 length:879 start_codon:yes stop_codon:yes gene_type:complete
MRNKIFWRTVFLSPPLIVFSIFVLIPLINSFYYSFTNWNGFNSEYDFVGLENYTRIASDNLFQNSIFNTVIWLISAILIPTILGLLLALLIDSQVRGSNFFKSIFYLPICLSAVVVGQIWIWIFQQEWGLLNIIINLFRENSFEYAWLSKPETSLYSVIIAWSWQQTALSMVIYLAGLTSIPKNLLEASQIEGANIFQRTFFIVIPLLIPATIIVVALSMINSLKGFDILYIMTQGGPFHSSDTLAMHMYNESFRKYRMGYGSAISVVLFFIAVTIIGIYFRQLKKLDELYD